MSLTMKPDPVQPNHPLHLSAKRRKIMEKLAVEDETVELPDFMKRDSDPRPLYKIDIDPVTHDQRVTPAGYKVGWKDVTIALLLLTVVFLGLWILIDQGVF